MIELIDFINNGGSELFRQHQYDYPNEIKQVSTLIDKAYHKWDIGNFNEVGRKDVLEASNRCAVIDIIKAAVQNKLGLPTGINFHYNRYTYKLFAKYHLSYTVTWSDMSTQVFAYTINDYDLDLGVQILQMQIEPLSPYDIELDDDAVEILVAHDKTIIELEG